MDQGIQHFLAGRLTQALASYRACVGVTQESGDRGSFVFSESQALLSEALAEALPRASFPSDALRATRDYLDTHFSHPIVWGQSAALAAAAVALHRQGVRQVPAELRRQLRRASIQCHLEHDQRPLYGAAQATVAAIQGQMDRSLKLFATTVTETEESGLLFHLLCVLRIAAAVLPEGGEARKYYVSWRDQLERNLREQPPLKLSEVETGPLPPAPDSGRPAGIVPPP
jgi:hypothetical protein